MSAYDPGTQTLLRILNTSWPVFRAFGVQVRVHWATALLPVLFYAGFSRFLDPVEAALWSAAWLFAAYLVIWTHEMGHIWAGRSVGVQTTRITLSPLGGLAHLHQGAPSPRTEVIISLAGPATHALWFVLAGAPYLFFVQGSGADDQLWALMLRAFLALNAALLFFNLLPFWPMDGGRTMRALLATRVHANHASLLTAYVGSAGAVIVGIVGIAMWIQGASAGAITDVGGPVLVGIAVSNFSACRLLLAEARWGEGPYDTSQPWKASLPQASWKLDDPGAPDPVESRRSERRSGEKPSGDRRTGEVRDAPAEKRARTTAEPARRREVARPAPRPVHERIDELLDRINEVGGVEHLTDAERKELAEASERLRRGAP